MYVQPGGKRSAGTAFANHQNIHKKSRKTKLLPPGARPPPKTSYARPSAVQSRPISSIPSRSAMPSRASAIPSRVSAIPSRATGMSTSIPSRPTSRPPPQHARPSRPPSARKSVRPRPRPQHQSQPRVMQGGYGSHSQPQNVMRNYAQPSMMGNFAKPSAGTALNGGFGASRPLPSFASPPSFDSVSIPNAIPMATSTSVPSLHQPNLTGPTTLMPTVPKIDRKFPDWVYEEKFGVLKFDENIMVYHMKGFPMCPWQDLVREGPLDPRWEQKKAENKKLEEGKEEEMDSDADEAYLPPGAVSHKKSRSRGDSSRSSLHNKTANRYPEVKIEKTRPVPKRILPTDISIPRKNPQRQAPPPKQKWKWIQCIFCSKWRKIPAQIPNEQLGDRWSCRMNKWDSTHNNCMDPQEMEEEEPQTAGTPATSYGYRAPTTTAPPPVEPMRQPRHHHQPRRRKAAPSRRPSGMSVSEALGKMSQRSPQYERSRRTFYASLEQFLGQSPPVTTLCAKPIDLYHLYNEVTQRGGYDEVTANKQWRQIFRTMENYNQSHTSASYALKKCYRKNLLDYEKQHASTGY